MNILWWNSSFTFAIVSKKCIPQSIKYLLDIYEFTNILFFFSFHNYHILNRSLVSSKSFAIFNNFYIIFCFLHSVLPLNIVNEKIFVFLWFWFIALTILSGISLVYRFAVCLWPKVRLYLLRARSRLSSHEDVEHIADKCQIGDWFILYQLGKNIDPLIYKEVITDLAAKLDGKTLV